MKKCFFIALFLSAANARAQSSVTTFRPSVVKDFEIEAQLNTMSNSTSTTFGPSLLYRITEKNQLGVRFLTPLSYGHGTMSFMAVYRHNFGRSKTNLFGELSIASNFYNQEHSFLNAPSAGTNLGILHHLTEDISFGGLAGTEWTNTHLGKDYAYNNSSDLVIYGRLSVFGLLAF